MFFNCVYVDIASLHWYVLVNAEGQDGAVNLGMRL